MWRLIDGMIKHVTRRCTQQFPGESTAALVSEGLAQRRDQNRRFVDSSQGRPGLICQRRLVAQWPLRITEDVDMNSGGLSRERDYAGDEVERGGIPSVARLRGAT
jgi:hypothetical protein